MAVAMRVDMLIRESLCLPVPLWGDPESKQDLDLAMRLGPARGGGRGSALIKTKGNMHIPLTRMYTLFIPTHWVGEEQLMPAR